MTNAFTLLDQQIVQLDKLSALLGNELDAFVSRDPDKILHIAQQKIELLNSITELDQQCNELPDIEELKNNIEFKNKVAQCDEHLASLKKQNSVNERVIQTSLNNVTQLKQSILALKNSDAMTYNKSGKAMTQTLGKGIKA